MGSKCPSSSCSLIADCTATVLAAIVSPSTMMVNRPYRSTMWCACQGVWCPCSAITGTISSAAARIRNSQRLASSGTNSSDTQPTWQITSPAAYFSAADRASPLSPAAARSHCAVRATRMMT